MTSFRYIIALMAAAALTFPFRCHGQVINTWEKGNDGGVVTSVDQGAIGEDDYAAQGIINDWSEILDEFERTRQENDAIETEIKGLKAVQVETGARNVFIGRDGKRYELPTMPSEDGTDMYLLTEEGATIYLAFDAPVYMQDIDDEILDWIRFYAYKRKSYTKRVFTRYKEWEPRIKAYFASEGVPEELAELCLIESGCTYSAKSSVGALGMWQIMPATGRSYGLTVNETRDDRLDPVLSTMTAAKILRRNYERIGEWTLATAAYNCGVGRFKKGQKWSEIKARLPKETRQYIPGLIAMHYVWTYRDRLGFE